MTLGSLFSGNLSLNSQLDIVRQRSTGRNYGELETKLNAIFYPTGATTNFNQEQERILDKEATLLAENIVKNANAILGEGPITVDSKKPINIKSIKNAIKSAEKTLSTLSSKLTNAKDVESTLLELQNIINNAKNEVQGYTNSTSFTWNSKNFYNFYSILNSLKSIASLSGLDVYNQNKGLILEEIFGGGASGSRSKEFNDFIDGVSNKLAENGIEGTRTGQLAQSRGGGSVYLAKFNLDKKSEQPKSAQIVNQIALGQLGDITSKINYNAGESRQIKMDVAINFKTSPTSTETFRASLKNWSNTHNRDLGTTSILGAILRTSGEAAAKSYSLSMLNKGSLLTAAHKMARLAILMDVITGFSQKTGYADTLIIHTGSAIRVIDPASLINEDYGENIQGYDEGEISQVAHNVLKAMKSLRSPGRTAIYYGNVQAYLAAKKVRVLMKFSNENKN